MIVIPWKWLEFYYLSSFLCSSCKGEKRKFSKEAEIRSGISRAYYAAFHYAEDYALKNSIHDFPPFNPSAEEKKSKSIHQLLINHYKDAKNDRIATDLEMLRDWRNYCDYHIDCSLDYKNALIMSARILNACSDEVID